MSLRRFIAFIQELFLWSSGAVTTRRLSTKQERPPALMRGALMRAVRQPDLASQVRSLQSSEQPVMLVELNEAISLNFDFNFGHGQKELLLGVQFHFDSDDAISNSVKDLLETFIRETLGGPSLDLGESTFSFADTATDLANDMIESLAIDVAVDLDFIFGLDLNPMFDSSTTSVMERLPNPYIRINKFDLAGVIGVNEWSTTLPFGDVEFSVAEAKALLTASASLSSSPIDITTPFALVDLVTPHATGGDRIVFAASLDVDFPVFLTYSGAGAGSRIQYT